MTERERMRSNIKALFSFTSKSKLQFVLAFSSQIQRWVPHWNDIHKKSTGTYEFQSSEMPHAFLLSAKDSIFLLVGSRMLTCLFFNVQEGFNASCLLDQARWTEPGPIFVNKASFLFWTQPHPFTYCVWLLLSTITVKLIVSKRWYSPQSQKYLVWDPLQGGKKVGWPLI